MVSVLCAPKLSRWINPLRNFPPCLHGASLTCPQGLRGLAVKNIATNSWSELAGLTSARI